MALKRILRVFGIAFALLGALWMAQGRGLIRWPEQSFMIDQTVWVTYGAILAVVGVAMVLVARRLR